MNYNDFEWNLSDLQGFYNNELSKIDSVNIPIRQYISETMGYIEECNPELIRLWRAWNEFQAACDSIAVEIGNTVNHYFNKQIENRCVFSTIDGKGLSFKLSLGQCLINGSGLEEVLKLIGNPSKEHYCLESRVAPGGTTELIIVFDAVSSSKLSCFKTYQDWNLGVHSIVPKTSPRKGLSRDSEGLYILPDDVSIEISCIPFMLDDGLPYIEAKVNGQPRSDILSRLDYDFLKAVPDSKIIKFEQHLVCKYLLCEQDYWVTDGIPLCFVNKENESKINIREYLLLPVAEQVNYLLYDRRWDGDFNSDNFVKDGHFNIVDWLESNNFGNHFSSLILSKRMKGYEKTVEEAACANKRRNTSKKGTNRNLKK